jgi:hypothetical protein
LVAAARGWIQTDLPASSLWLAGLAPIGAATVVAWAAGGSAGLRVLYGRFSLKRLPMGWSLVALLLPLAFGLVSLALNAVRGEVTLTAAMLPLALAAVAKVWSMHRSRRLKRSAGAAAPCPGC